ncbi:aromatic amino acid ammonia-lyase [Nocardia sp. NEAU-G5]|uniref:Aromatic amino acid ammonia-lyase n=1 Tax=Nocardia albiluteola TaxID=2842303 RepID=A0ABS6B5G9_9NOCA|nr:aromatic amino acid ammonia-lyase [Nocardia albiluteola]MBU3064981.1 aromatic amino acid ammonia-lyase [Nocardia albiluteola]
MLEQNSPGHTEPMALPGYAEPAESVAVPGHVESMALPDCAEPIALSGRAEVVVLPDQATPMALPSDTDPLPEALSEPVALSGGLDSLTMQDDGPPLLPLPSRGSRHVELILDGDSLRWRDIVAVLEADSVEARLAESAREVMARARAGAVGELLRADGPRVYGWNQALGPLKDRALADSEQRQFQINILRSHAAGVGEHLSAPIARLALILRANALARGTAGVRPEVVDRMLAVLNAGIVPLMPEVGSLGTGDLQPMAAAGLLLIGDRVPAADPTGVTTAPEALRRAKLAVRFDLEAGEALSLISGSAVLCACYAAAVRRSGYQFDTFMAAFAMFCEATRAERQAFDPRMHAERRIPQEAVANARILALVSGSEWMTRQGRARLGEICPRIQDSTSVRSTPHKAASMLRTIEEAKRQLVWEANASTSNPLVLENADGCFEFVTGGNWDCSLLGHSAHMLNVHVTDIAVLAKDLSGRLGNDLWSYGLPTSLSGGKVGLNSGMTLVHAVGASLIPEMHARSTPVSSLSFPIKGGQEDHNTMAMASVRNLVSNLDRFDVVLGVLVLMAAQGIDLIADRMRGLRLGRGTARAHAVVRGVVEPLADDRYMTDDMEKVTALVRSGLVTG